MVDLVVVGAESVVNNQLKIYRISLIRREFSQRGGFLQKSEDTSGNSGQDVILGGLGAKTLQER